MAYVDWRMKGIQISNCNCATGCPCQFNSLPTHGNCRAYVFFSIDSGHFGKVRLDGLRWGGLFAWPGPIHLGEGTAMAVIDERADADQRAALEAIAQGRETEPGSLITQVFCYDDRDRAADPVQADRARDRREGRHRARARAGSDRGVGRADQESRHG